MAKQDAGKNTLPEPVPILAPALSIRQLTLFHRKAVIETRPANGTADCAGEAEADDGHRYYLKMDAGGKHTRASEWIGTHLAEAIGISGPFPAPIELMDGSLAFGSRRISGVADQMTTTNYLLRSTLSEGRSNNLSRLLSSIYAYDLFINNVDRHTGNYLTIPDGDVRRLFAFDYSRAFFWDWPWSGFPARGSRTRDVGRVLWERHGFDVQAADETLTKISTNFSMENMRLILELMPEDWLPQAVARRLEHAWDGKEKSERILSIKEGMASGWLL